MSREEDEFPRGVPVSWETFNEVQRAFFRSRDENEHLLSRLEEAEKVIAAAKELMEQHGDDLDRTALRTAIHEYEEGA